MMLDDRFFLMLTLKASITTEADDILKYIHLLLFFSRENKT